MEDKPILEIKNVTYRYHDEPVLENINLRMNKGDFLGVLGPNGSGKSTLLKLILRLLKLQKGEIFLYGQPIDSFNQWEKIGFVSQKANSFNTGFPATVYEVVRSGLTKKTGMFHFFPKDTKQKVIRALKLMEMEEYLERNIGELSGGQQQRVFIARAIVSNPEILILDEPTVGIDANRVANFYRLMERLNKEEKMTLILVTHDFGSITNKLSHIAYLNRRIHYFGKANEFKTIDILGGYQLTHTGGNN